MSTPGHKRKALTFTVSRVKMSRPIQKRPGPDILTPPDLGGLRGIRNQGGSCTGPITIGNLASVTTPGLRPRTADDGEILTGFCTLLGQEGMIHHLAPEASLATSVRKATKDRAFLQPKSGVHDGNTLIFQFGRSDPTGSKIKRHTAYPVTLDAETYKW